MAIRNDKVKKESQLNNDDFINNKRQPTAEGHRNGNNLTIGGVADDASKRRTSVASNEPGNVGADSVKQNASKQLSVLKKGYVNPLDDTIDSLYDKILGGKGFEYDAYADPTYNQYAEMYKKNAALASEDVLAQAAGLTGGQNSSYAQAVATQAYNDKMSELNDIVPELRENAYAKWQDERNRDIEALSLMLNERDYDRAIFENDRSFDESQRQYDESLAENKRQFDAGLAFEEKAFAEDQRQFDANLSEDQRQFDANLSEDKRQFDAGLGFDYANLAEDKRQFDSKQASEREQLALSAGFSSWDEYIKFINANSGKPSADNDTFDNTFLNGAVKAYQENGENGLIAYFDVYGDEYDEEALSLLGDDIVSGYTYNAPADSGVTYPSDIPVINNIAEAEKYFEDKLTDVTKEDKRFLESLLSYDEMKSDGVDDANDTSDAYRRYLSWKVSEYLQNRKKD